MEQKTLSKWLKCVVVGIGICGLVILALLIPSSEYIEHFWHWLFFIFASSIPCYIALFLGWKIATNIGNNRSFSEANARLLKSISILFAADAIFFLVGNIFLFLINSSNFEVLLVCSIVAFIGAAVSVVSAILSRLTQKAAKLKEQDDWTIEEDQRKSMFHED